MDELEVSENFLTEDNIDVPSESVAVDDLTDWEESGDALSDEIAAESTPETIEGLSDLELSAAMLDDEFDDEFVESIPPDTADAPSLTEALSDPELFERQEAGEYTYADDEFGKKAWGVLELAEDPERDLAAQRQAGGADRLSDDDGGHLVGARFGGASGEENLDAQNSNLNRGAYKALENQWANELNDGDQVFVDVETYKSNESDRPDAYMGYEITEKADGSRDWDAFSFQNESAETQEEWASTVEDMDDA